MSQDVCFILTDKLLESRDGILVTFLHSLCTQPRGDHITGVSIYLMNYMVQYGITGEWQALISRF